jgi:DNA-3-methyladenine glycosylase
MGLRTAERESEETAGWPGALLKRSFFEASPEQIAPRLLGQVLAHRTPHGLMAGRIVEVEAYLGPHNDPPDPAAHSYRGPTDRNRILFAAAGHAYVYAIYGRYFCMNVSCEVEGRAGCVLLRALEPLVGQERMALNRNLTQELKNEVKPADLTSGPSRLCQALGLTRALHNGLDLTDTASPLQLREDGFVVEEALVTTRIGIHDAVDWPLRFAVIGSPCVSGLKRLTGNRVRLDALL